jgi:hypothetical protein
MLDMNRSVLLDPDVQASVEEMLQDYPPFLARADQTVAAARSRSVVLQSLMTALAEHGETLRRMRGVQGD